MSEPNRLSGTVVTSIVKDQEVRFFVQDPRDCIQGVHYNGCFYERHYLETCRRFFQPGGVFLDIGANVGNHTVFAEKFLKAGEVIPIEPNPDAIAILRLNIALNGLQRVNQELLGIALSDKAANHDIAITPNNLGMAMLSQSETGAIRSIVGDNLFEGRTIDFIKLDVEGMEMAVLSGLKRTIAKNRPPMFVEVDLRNRDTFRTWLEENSYQITARARQGPVNQDLFIQPLEKISLT